MVVARLLLTALSLVSCTLASAFYRSNDPPHRELCFSVRVRVPKRMAGDMVAQIDPEQVPRQLGDIGILQQVSFVDRITDQHNEGLPPDRFRRSGSLSNRSRQKALLNNGLGGRDAPRHALP